MKFKLVAVALFVLGVVSGPAATAQQNAAGARGQSALIFCRWVVDGQLAVRGWESVRDGEKKTIDLTTPKSFVIGAKQEGEASDDGEIMSRRPVVETVNEGTTLEIMVVERRPAGLTLDVKVEQTTITAIEHRTDAVNHKRQVPLVETRHKRVNDSSSSTTRYTFLLPRKLPAPGGLRSICSSEVVKRSASTCRFRTCSTKI